MSNSIESIKVGNEIIGLYPLRTHFENILKLGYAAGLAEYSHTENTTIIPTDIHGLGELQCIHDEIMSQITSGIEAISSVLAYVDRNDVGERNFKDLASLINSLSSMQFSLLDVGVVLNATELHLNRSLQSRKAPKKTTSELVSKVNHKLKILSDSVSVINKPGRVDYADLSFVLKDAEDLADIARAALNKNRQLQMKKTPA